MPSEGQPRGPDRRRFEVVKSDIGEDPARWLDQEILGHEDREFMVRVRIDSIDRFEVIAAWRAVERRLAALDDREPRDTIMTRLDQREEELEEIGQRPDRRSFGPRRPPEHFDTASAFPDHDQRTAAERLQQQVATDGGETDG